MLTPGTRLGPVRGGELARDRGHGRGLPRARLQAEAGGRDQGLAGDVRPRYGTCREAAARGRGARVAQSSSHRRDLRPRRAGLRRFWCSNSWRARRWPIASRAAGCRATRRSRSPGRSPRRSKRPTTKGIIHRDLKPANIKISRDGQRQGARLRPGEVHVDATAAPDLSNSPTMTATTPGMILGTAAYMRPEQANGQGGSTAPTSGRSDACCTRC